MLVNRVILATLDGVKKDLSGLLNAFEKAVIFGATGSRLLVWMMAENFLAMGTLDLFQSGAVAILAQTEDSVVILTLHISVRTSTFKCLKTF